MTKPQKKYPHNVDICVTCVSEKPPQLPLREELPSLGIEVVYNAQGIGAKASKHESKKLVKQFREKEQVKELKNPRFFSQSPKRVKEKQQERKRQENKLRVPKALSYQSYENKLLHNESTESSSSISSWETNSTSDSSASGGKQKKKSKGWGRFRPAFTLGAKKKVNKVVEDPANPPETVEIPTAEENALNEAYSAFADVSIASKETQKTSSRSRSQSTGNKDSTPSEGPSSGLDPSTLSTKAEDFNAKVEVVASPSTKTELPGLKGISEGSSSGSSSLYRLSVASGGASQLSKKSQERKQAETRSESGTSEVDASTLSSMTLTAPQNPLRFHSSPDVQMALPNLPLDTSNSTKGNSTISTNKDAASSVKVQFISDQSSVKEFFDLTALSEDDVKTLIDSSSLEKDLSTLSSKKDLFGSRNGVQVYSSPTVQQQLPGLKLGMSEVDNAYRQSAMDLSSGDEESDSSESSSQSVDADNIHFADGDQGVLQNGNEMKPEHLQSLSNDMDTDMEGLQTQFSEEWLNELRPFDSEELDDVHISSLPQRLTHQKTSSGTRQSAGFPAKDNRHDDSSFDYKDVPMLSPTSSSEQDMTDGDSDPQSSEDDQDNKGSYNNAPAKDSLKLLSSKKPFAQEGQSFSDDQYDGIDSSLNSSSQDSENKTDGVLQGYEDTQSKSEMQSSYSTNHAITEQSTFRYSRISPLRAAQGKPLRDEPDDRLHKVSFSQDVEEHYYEPETVGDNETHRTNSSEKTNDSVDPVEKFYEDTSPKNESSDSGMSARLEDRDAELEALAEKAFQITLDKLARDKKKEQGGNVNESAAIIEENKGHQITKKHNAGSKIGHGVTKIVKKVDAALQSISSFEKRFRTRVDPADDQSKFNNSGKSTQSSSNETTKPGGHFKDEGSNNESNQAFSSPEERLTPPIDPESSQELWKKDGDVTPEFSRPGESLNSPDPVSNKDNLNGEAIHGDDHFKAPIDPCSSQEFQKTDDEAIQMFSSSDERMNKPIDPISSNEFRQSDDEAVQAFSGLEELLDTPVDLASSQEFRRNNDEAIEGSQSVEENFKAPVDPFSSQEPPQNEADIENFSSFEKLSDASVDPVNTVEHLNSTGLKIHTYSKYGNGSPAMYTSNVETRFSAPLIHTFSRPEKGFNTTVDASDEEYRRRPDPQDPPTDASGKEVGQEPDEDFDAESNSLAPSESSDEMSSKNESFEEDDEAGNDPTGIASTRMNDHAASEHSLMAALSQGDVAPEEIARTRLPDGRFPLHVACSREFPDRFSNARGSITHELVKDLIGHKRLIEVIAIKNMSACMEPDAAGDLPVHILARRLIEWEAQWYQKVYEKAQQDNRKDGDTAGITKLYQTMSQVIDMLLEPVVGNGRLCRFPGSVGRLLPLHIAAIFTVSYNTLRLTLEGFPDAAAITCDLKDIRTFIPANSLPLELHDRLSTDFPKWEVTGGDAEVDPESYTRWENSFGSKNCLRRSDLMFAFNPEVMPYRHDSPRIRRIESRVRLEATKLYDDDDDDDVGLTPAASRLWIWLCTFQGRDRHDDTYVDSVKRVVQNIPLQCVQRLATVQTEDGPLVVDAAIPECSDVIMDRLNTISGVDVPVPIGTLKTTSEAYRRSPILRKWEKDMAESFYLQGRGYVAVLCRLVFNITEERFPTSFVFLPYKLVKDEEGRLGLDSPDAAGIAMKFADCLLQLTCPKKILHFLEKKAIRFLGQSLGTEDDRTWFETDAAIKEQVDKLLSLYESGPAYFYFLDELTGMPVVPGRGGLYPFVVNDPLDMIRKVLPLMLTGMILMRGGKALSVIANIVLSKKISIVQTNWIEAAKDIVGYLHSPQTEWTTSFVQDLLPLKEDLLDLIETGPSENAPRRDAGNLSSEWVVELSLVRMVVEMHDPTRSFAGLRPKHGSHNVLWTRDSSFLDSTKHLSRFDFNVVSELREASSDEDEQDERLSEQSTQEGRDRQSRSDSSSCSSDFEGKGEAVGVDGYNHLFGDLAMSVPNNQSDDSSEKSGLRQTWSGFQEPGPGFVPFVPKKHRYATEQEPISLLTFDESLGLDDVLQLRIQLDEQEAKLEFLKDKINGIQESELDLIKQEEDLGRMLHNINNAAAAFQGPETKGLVEARKLLIRLCDLEERVLCREIEVQQLKFDVSVFELETSDTSDASDGDLDEGSDSVSSENSN